MPPDINQIEEERKGRLSQARNIAKLGKDAFDASHGSPKAILSLGKRFGKHWPIIAIAALFDLFALIPFVSVVVNICFGAILFMYFGKKRIISGVVLPIGILSVFDFIFSLLPVNIATAIIRIALKETVG